MSSAGLRKMIKEYELVTELNAAIKRQSETELQQHTHTGLYVTPVLQLKTDLSPRKAKTSGCALQCFPL